MIFTSGPGLAFAPDGTLYLLADLFEGPYLYTVDPETAEGSEVGPFGSNLDCGSALAAIGDVLYASAYTNFGPPYFLLVTVDRNTGAATEVGGFCADKDCPFMSGLAFLPGAGDGDRDGDVDADDVEFFEACFGPLDEPEKSPYCAFLDSDKNGDLDCADWEAFIPNWTEDTDPPTFAPCDCETPPCDVPCEGDANADGTVDPLDTGYIMARFGCPVGTGDPLCDAADANLDTLVDPLDVGYVMSRFGECP